MEDIVKRLQACYTGAVYDVLRDMGYQDQVLPSYIKSISNPSKIAGQIFTIEGSIDTSITKDESLLSWCKMLSASPPGKILMCQPNDRTISHMGELSAETLAYKNVLGYIVDGGCRDVSFIREIDFPVFCQYFTPKDIVSRWKVTSMGETINIRGVKIQTDDFVLADEVGIIVIPSEIIEEVVERTEEVLNTENKVRTAILQGIDPVEAYLRYGKF